MFTAREDRYPDDYESDEGEGDMTSGEPSTQFATCSIRFSRLLEGEDLESFCDLTVTSSPPSYPKEDAKQQIESPIDKSIPDLMAQSDKEEDKLTDHEEGYWIYHLYTFCSSYQLYF